MVVSFSLETPRADLPRTDPPITLGRQVWGFSDCTPQNVEGGRLVLLPRSVEDYRIIVYNISTELHARLVSVTEWESYKL